jgi:hypothetical protein
VLKRLCFLSSYDLFGLPITKTKEAVQRGDEREGERSIEREVSNNPEIRWSVK